MNFGGLGGLFGGLTGNFGGNNAFGGFNAPKDAFGLPTAVAKTHLGIASCNLLKDYTSSYPFLYRGVRYHEIIPLGFAAYWA